MPDDDFEPHLGRKRGRGREARYLGLVVKAMHRAGRTGASRSRRFDGSRIGRGAAVGRALRSRDRHSALRARRAIVKTRLVRLAGKGFGAAAANLRYVQRDGVTREGEPGVLYSAADDIADGKQFLERCRNDRHQFRFIISAEDADQYDDLKPLTRRLMSRMEADLGTRLDWVAVDHFNTSHPHSHVVLRGVDDRGANLVISREYISHGLRERAMEIVSLDLGPRTDLEIEERLRADVEAERLTAVDRRLIREMDAGRLVAARDRDPFRQALRTGRLQKLAAMGLATPFGGTTWQLAEGLADTLREIGERGDIVRTMQRELTARKLERSAAERTIFDPRAEGAVQLSGRVIARGLADELADRHYLIVDGIDGRTHYVEIGRPSPRGMERERLESFREGTIVRITPRQAGAREVDRTVARVAAANGGRYTIDAHLRDDPSSTRAFAEAHVRRLEAMRRLTRAVERHEDGSWTIPPDHLARAEAFETRQWRDRPVEVETLSPIPLEELPLADAATWLDRQLLEDGGAGVRDQGFGREVRAAIAARRRWLIAQELAEERDGGTRYRPGLIATLRRRELVRIARRLSDELGLPFAETRAGERIEGIYRRSLDTLGGRMALIERSHEFTLVPWRPVLERQAGKAVAGIVREGGISWTFGRQRSGPALS